MNALERPGGFSFALFLVGSGQWTMDSGQWVMDSGQWTMDSGQWAVGSGELRGRVNFLGGGAF